VSDNFGRFRDLPDLVANEIPDSIKEREFWVKLEELFRKIVKEELALHSQKIASEAIISPWALLDTSGNNTLIRTAVHNVPTIEWSNNTDTSDPTINLGSPLGDQSDRNRR
jgi:hypothetical protein